VEAVEGVRVRGSGSALIPSEAYSVKLEGAELVGYQSIIVGGIRDAFLIKRLDTWLAGVRERIEAGVAKIFGDRLSKSQYHLELHVYGRDGVMGKLEPDCESVPK